MIYRKNIYAWEQVLRLLAGAAMVVAGLAWFAGGPLGWLLVASGAFTALTGLFGYCPACAIAGRKVER